MNNGGWVLGDLCLRTGGGAGPAALDSQRCWPFSKSAWYGIGGGKYKHKVQ